MVSQVSAVHGCRTVHTGLEYLATLVVDVKPAFVVGVKICVLSYLYADVTCELHCLM